MRRVCAKETDQDSLGGQPGRTACPHHMLSVPAGFGPGGGCSGGADPEGGAGAQSPQVRQAAGGFHFPPGALTGARASLWLPAGNSYVLGPEKGHESLAPLSCSCFCFLLSSLSLFSVLPPSFHTRKPTQMWTRAVTSGPPGAHWTGREHTPLPTHP